MTGNKPGKGGRVKLLLVDDEVAYVNILSKRLAKRNFEVTTALSGTQGIQALRKDEFDVAVVDLKMQDMDGIDVLKGIQEDGSRDGCYNAHRPRVGAGRS